MAKSFTDKWTGKFTLPESDPDDPRLNYLLERYSMTVYPHTNEPLQDALARGVKTMESNPDHPTIGHHFAYGDSGGVKIWLCTSHDPRTGFWMQNIHNPEVLKNISERAIRATFWPAEERDTNWYVPQWCKSYEKTELVARA